MTDDKKIDYILRTVEERDIRYLRLCFTDVLGNLKALSISPEELEEAFIEGIGFDGSSVDGFASQAQSDLLAFPAPRLRAIRAACLNAHLGKLTRRAMQ